MMLLSKFKCNSLYEKKEKISNFKGSYCYFSGDRNGFNQYFAFIL
jgi:hypothetical protein